MAKIPKKLQSQIDNAYENEYEVPMIGIALPDGYVNITPRGSTQVYDDDHISLWERGKGSTTDNLKDGSKVTVFFRKPDLRTTILPKGAVARLYGTAKVHKSGPVYDQVWERLIKPEKDRDPDKKGFAVLIKIDRAEDLSGDPLKLD